MEVRIDACADNRTQVLFAPESTSEQEIIRRLKSSEPLSDDAMWTIYAWVISALNAYGYPGFSHVRYEEYVDQCFIFAIGKGDYPPEQAA